jgi:hypothetical protein
MKTKILAINKIIANLDGQGFDCFLSYHGQDTLFQIQDEHTGQTWTGIALCHECDQFNKKVGTLLAFQRAMETFSKSIGREKLKGMLKGE